MKRFTIKRSRDPAATACIGTWLCRELAVALRKLPDFGLFVKPSPLNYLCTSLTWKDTLLTGLTKGWGISALSVNESEDAAFNACLYSIPSTPALWS